MDLESGLFGKCFARVFFHQVDELTGSTHFSYLYVITFLFSFLHFFCFINFFSDGGHGGRGGRFW